MRRILIVDDSPVVLAQLSNDLADDYEIVTAGSGEEAIEILEVLIRGNVCFSNLFDLIITDLKLPGMTGFELAEYVRKKNKFNRYTPVILLTTEKISTDEARKHGCVAHFSKSDKQRLVSMVRMLMSL